VIPFGIRANFDSRTSRREQLGLTLRELATRSGVSSSMISDIERGAKSPTLSTLSALVQALGVSMSALLDSASPKSGRIHVVRASERPERSIRSVAHGAITLDRRSPAAKWNSCAMPSRR